MEGLALLLTCILARRGCRGVGFRRSPSDADGPGRFPTPPHSLGGLQRAPLDCADRRAVVDDAARVPILGGGPPAGPVLDRGGLLRGEGARPARPAALATLGVDALLFGAGTLVLYTPVQQCPVEPVPDTDGLPVAQLAPAGDAAAIAHLLGQHLLRSAALEHKQNFGQGGTVWDAGAPPPVRRAAAGRRWPTSRREGGARSCRSFSQCS